MEIAFLKIIHIIENLITLILYKKIFILILPWSTTKKIFPLSLTLSETFRPKIRLVEK